MPQPPPSTQFTPTNQHIPVAIFETNEGGHFLFGNSIWYKMTGLSLEESNGLGWMSIFEPEDHQSQELLRIALQGQKIAHETRLRVRSRKFTWVYFRIEPILTDYGQVRGMMGMVMDLTEKRQSEDVLKANEQGFRALIEYATDIITVLEPDGRIRYISPTFYRLFDYHQQEILGHSISEFVHPSDLEKFEETLGQYTAQHGVKFQIEYRFRKADGTYLYLDGVGRNLCELPQVRGFVINSRNITERKETERKLRLLNSVVANSQEAIAVTDANVLDEAGPRIVYSNDAFSRISGYTSAELLNRAIGLMHGPQTEPSLLAKIREAFVKSYPLSAELTLYRKGEEKFMAEMNVVPLAEKGSTRSNYVVTIRDITERRKSEEELILTRKMSVAGKLTGSFALEFDTLLAPAFNALSSMEKELAGSPLIEKLRQAEQQLLHARELSRRALSLGRESSSVRSMITLNGVVNESLDMVKNTLPPGIAVAPQLQPGLRPLMANRNDVSQILFNLIANARDTIVQKHEAGAADDWKPQITIQTYAVSKKNRGEASSPRSFQVMAVSDNGMGISLHNQEMLFLPFFTTKTHEPGAGLGLATVWNMAKAAGGWVELNTNPGEGSTFFVFIPETDSTPEISPAVAPVAKAPEQPAPPPRPAIPVPAADAAPAVPKVPVSPVKSQASPPPAPPGQAPVAAQFSKPSPKINVPAARLNTGVAPVEEPAETDKPVIPSSPPTARLSHLDVTSGTVQKPKVMIVEDNELICETLQKYLTILGYEVDTSRNGSEAIIKMMQMRNQFDAIITDLNMPMIAGDKLIERLKKDNFNGKIIVMTGFLSKQTDERLRKLGVDDILQKPISPQKIAQHLGRLIGKDS
ncbi:MAG: PAS domain S-box protein [Verrucomicrobiae bacterium]|nr:PAS domain S-box protein [Verrucomicrobiae bacterium]